MAEINNGKVGARRVYKLSGERAGELVVGEVQLSKRFSAREARNVVVESVTREQTVQLPQ